MNKCLFALLALALTLAACGGSSGGSSASSTDVAVWDQAKWDSGATWQP